MTEKRLREIEKWCAHSSAVDGHAELIAEVRRLQSRVAELEKALRGDPSFEIASYSLEQPSVYRSVDSITTNNTEGPPDA